MERPTDSRPTWSEDRRSSLIPPYATWYDVPSMPVIVSVEHPCIIKDVDKGLATLGGPDKLENLVQDSTMPSTKLYLRPGDRMARPLHSANVSTNNILLKVTVPKRTGLKRRRGAQGPYYEGLDEPDSNLTMQNSRPVPMIKDAQYLLRTLRDNYKHYHVEAVGSINQTHRFRGIPDFVYSTANSPFIAKMKEHILPFDYEKMKGFEFDMSKGVEQNTEIIPPPSWSQHTFPFNYSYRQNPSVKKVVDRFGKITTINVQAPSKVQTSVLANTPVVPTGPPPDLPPFETLEPALQRLIVAAHRLMENRPIFTRRALANCLSGKDWDLVGQNTNKQVFKYAGYMFSSGPWRDAIVKFGVDPRKDPRFRIYQTLVFMLETEPRDNRSKLYTRTKAGRTKTPQELRNESHLFDGVNLSKDGKLWQVCDFTDPLLKEVLATTNLRSECHLECDGFYHNGTWAKAKILAKAKALDILNGVPSYANQLSFEKVARDMPDIIQKGDGAARLGKQATPLERNLASNIRTAAFMHRSASIYKIGAAAEDDGEEEQDDGEEEQDDEIEDLALHEHEILDPRIMEAVSELNRVEGATAQVEDLVYGMELDDGLDLPLVEASSSSLQ